MIRLVRMISADRASPPPTVEALRIDRSHRSQGRSLDPVGIAASVPDALGGPRAGARGGQVDRRDQERQLR